MIHAFLTVLLFSMLTLTACQSKNASPAQNLARGAKFKDKPVPKDLQLIFLKGSCERGVLAADGQRALALCTKTEGPAQPQLYLLDLVGPVERRITWQDGTVSSADWLDNNLLAYSSTTDELKEIPFLAVKPPPEEIPSDIYLSDRVGDSIRRLTRRLGFDGDLSYWPKNKDLLYISRQGKDDRIERINPQGKSSLVYLSRGRFVRSPAGLSNGRVAWLEASADGENVDMRVSGMKAPRLQGRRLLSLRPAPGGQAWLAVESFTDGSARVLLVGLDPACERTLTDMPLDLRFVDGSLSPPRLLLSLTTGMQGVFALKDLPGEGFSCTPPASSIK